MQQQFEKLNVVYVEKNG